MKHMNSIVPLDKVDEVLFAQIVRGDERAFSLVFQKYNRLLYVLAYRYLMSKDMAEDAVQQVFVNLWEYRKELDIEISLKNYLFTMTKNYVLNVIRHENTVIEKQYELAQRTSVYADDLLEKMERQECRELFYKAIERLPSQKRKICLMKIEEELSNQEIADTLHLSVNTIKTHYMEAIKLIRKYLTELLVIVILVIISLSTDGLV